MISIKGEWITSNIEQRVTDASTGPEMRKYIMERFKWNEESFNCVNWEEIEQARRGCSKKENIMVSKLMFDWIDSGHQKAKMEQEKGCPCCGADDETLEHIFQFTNKQMCKVRNEIFEMVTKTLQGIRCPDQVVCPFVEALKCLSEGKDITITERIGKKVATAIEDQRWICKHLMLRGILSRKWRDAIAEYTKERISSKEGHLIKVIWKQVFKPLWNQ